MKIAVDIPDPDLDEAVRQNEARSRKEAVIIAIRESNLRPGVAAIHLPRDLAPLNGRSRGPTELREITHDPPHDRHVCD
jgi:hypothetical protein